MCMRQSTSNQAATRRRDAADWAKYLYFLARSCTCIDGPCITQMLCTQILYTAYMYICSGMHKQDLKLMTRLCIRYMQICAIKNKDVHSLMQLLRHPNAIMMSKSRRNHDEQEQMQHIPPVLTSACHRRCRRQKCRIDAQVRQAYPLTPTS